MMQNMPTLTDLIREGRLIEAHRPWRRAVVQQDVWAFAGDRLAAGCWTLLGLWGEAGAVHMALFEEQTAEIGVISLECPENRFPSIGRVHAPAIRLERAIRDIFGLEPEGLPDQRPWVDHGCWDVRFPLGSAEPSASLRSYTFLPVEGESLHQIPVGPVHAGIIEPGHFRFTARGETIVRLEERLGYAHKGIEALMNGSSLSHAVRLAGRTSGDSTVAYALAFSQAVEAALGIAVPARAQWLRALMAELERLANHLGDIGAICNDAAFSLMYAHCGILREYVLRAADACWGHRLMQDRVIPGGVVADMTLEGLSHIRATISEIHRRLPPLVELYDNTASLQDRTVGTGVVRLPLVRQFGAGGYIGRASGRAFDARKVLRYAPYEFLEFDVPVLDAGDVNARVWVRIREVQQGLSLIEQIADGLPDGPINRELPAQNDGAHEGLALVEGFRGDILAWVRISSDGRLERCHLRDPSWFQWPLLEAAVEGNIVADFPLCNKSFNCSYSGHDL